MICDIKGAEKAWIRDIQGNLKLEKSFDQLKGMLNVIEVEGILRREGRLGNMNLPYEAKKPCLLQKDSLFTNLVVQECHQRIMHGGVNATLAEVRRQFWIPKGRQVAKKMLSVVYAQEIELHLWEYPAQVSYHEKGLHHQEHLIQSE